MAGIKAAEGKKRRGINPQFRSFFNGQGTLIENWEKRVEELSERSADMIQARFIFKATDKLARIFERKGEIPEVRPIDITINQGNMQAALSVEFSDESAFIVCSTTVFGYSSRGNLFMRIPMTFHDPVLPDGSEMGGLAKSVCLRFFQSTQFKTLRQD